MTSPRPDFQHDVIMTKNTHFPTRRRTSDPHLNVIRRQVSLHVAVLLFGRGRGWLVGGWEVGPVKRAERQRDTRHGERRPPLPVPSPPAPLHYEKSCLHLPCLSLFLCPGFLIDLVLAALLRRQQPSNPALSKALAGETLC